MSELQFPKDPIVGQQYDFPPYKYYWDGIKWKTKGIGYNPVNALRDEVLPTMHEALRRSYAEAGLNLVDGSFEGGGTIAKSNDVLLHNSTGIVYSGPVGSVAPGTDPTLPGSGYVPRMDEVLRTDVVLRGELFTSYILPNEFDGDFSSFEASCTGRIIDLGGKTFTVAEMPTGNVYVNGNFTIGAVTVSAMQNRAIISADDDTGGLDAEYTGGMLHNPTVKGRGTDHLYALIASQNSRSEGPARAVNVGSIYCHAKGNVSGNYSSRHSLAWSPQSVNIASEECRVVGGFRGANVASIYSDCDNESNANVACRNSSASARNSVNIASDGSFAGRGGKAILIPVISGGALVSIEFAVGNDGVKVFNGVGYQAGDPVVFFDTLNPSPVYPTVTVATVDGNGAILTFTISNPGSGMSDEVNAKVDNGLGDFSTNVASIGCHSEGLVSANVAQGDSIASGTGSANMAGDTNIASGNHSATLASASSTTSGAASVVVGSYKGIASGAGSGVYSSRISSATVGNAVVTGSDSCTASGLKSGVYSSSGSTASGGLSVALASNICTASADGAVVIGRRTENNSTRSIAFGDSGSGAASTANRKFHVFSNGNLSIAGTLSQNATFTDIAKMFENANYGEIPVGSLVTIEGRKVRLAKRGDRFVSAHSRTYVQLLGDSQFAWSGRYKRDEFGQLIYGDVWDEDAGEVDNETGTHVGGYVIAPLENTEYEPTLEQIPRSERRNEWTPVAMLGEVFVRVDATVAVGSFVGGSDVDGIGTAADTGLYCMEVTSEFDEAKGYAIALCLVK